MKSLGTTILSQSDKKYFCNILYTLQEEDVFFTNKVKYSLISLFEMFIDLGVVWLTSDNRVKLTNRGNLALQDLLVGFVDFNPKSIKLYNTKYE